MRMKISWQLIDLNHRVGRFKAVREVLLNDLHRKLRREFFRIPPGSLWEGREVGLSTKLTQSTSTIIERSTPCELPGTPATGISVKTTSKRYVLEVFMLLFLMVLSNQPVRAVTMKRAVCVPRVT
jgi:hypothetical protein